MEFGIHDDYVPDYGVIYGLKQPFYLVTFIKSPLLNPNSPIV